MKKHTFYIILSFFPFLIYSQHKIVEVDYTYEIKADSKEEFKILTKLVDNGENSIFVFPDSIISPDFSNYKIFEKGGIFYSRKKDELKMVESIFNKEFYIIEKNFSEKMKWQLISDDTKEILGYHCKAAKLNFRGRNYTAYYSEDLIFSSGPHKFFGLPGLILNVQTEDNLFYYTATKIQLKTKKIEIENPYAEIFDKDFISFKEYKKLFQRKINQALKKLQSETKDDTTYEMNDNSMELYD